MAGGWDAPWRHHSLSTPPLAALSLYAAVSLAWFLHQPGIVCTVAAAGGFVSVLVVFCRQVDPRVAIYVSVCTASAVGWSVYALMISSPFVMRWSIASLAVATAVLWPGFAGVTWVDRRDRRQHAEAAAALLAKRAVRGEWEAMFAVLGCADITQLEAVETRAGRTYTFRLPGHGKTTFTRVSALGEQLETALDLPQGAIRFRRAAQGSGTFYVDVISQDVRAEVIPLPRDFTARSVNDPFPIGRDIVNGEEIEVLLREVLTMIFAQRGSGKSNLLMVLLAQLARCVDVVIWMIDLKGGRVARPWLAPWFDGRTERPVLDWVATTLGEAKLMSECAVKAIEFRSLTSCGEKIIPSARQPAIFVICDEGTNLTGLRTPGSTALVNLLVDLINRGRSEAVDAILSYLRANVNTTGTSDLKAQAMLKIALGASSAADGTSALDHAGAGSEVAGLEHPGEFVLQHKTERLAGKVFRVEYDEVPAIAEACSTWRPGLEEPLETYLGDPYAQRWSLERSGHLLPLERQRELGLDPLRTRTETPAPGGAAVAVATAPTIELRGIPEPPTDAHPAYRTAAGQPIPRSNAHLDDADIDAMFAGLRTELDGIGRGVSIGRERTLAIIRSAGQRGIGPADILAQLRAEKLAPGRQALQDWLRAEVEVGTIIRRGKGDYIWAADV